MATKQHQADAANQELDPKYEWQENAANFVLRVHLSGFRKEDFRVQVDGAGRLTVRGQRADGGKHVRFHKVFQLPPTSNLDDVSGRFDAGVLTLTVPKRPAPTTTATIEDIRTKPQMEDNAETKKTPPPQVESKGEVKKAEQHKEAETKMPREKKAETKKPEEKKAETKKPEEDARTNKAEQKPKDQEGRNKAAADDEKIKAAVEAKPEQEQKKTAAVVTKEEAKPKATDGPTTETKVVDRESLVERVRRRAKEEERAKAAAAEEAERQRKQKQGACCGGSWKERVAEELQGLTTSEWVDTVKNNKELIAAAVAAFSLGLFVSSRLFSRN